MTTKYAKEHPKQLRLEADIANILTQTMVSVNTLCHPNFAKLVNEIDGGLKWPGRNTVVRRIIPETYEKIQTRLQDMLDSVTSLAITCDIWSTKHQRGFVGVTVHLVDPDWRLQSALLACMRFTGFQTAEAIFQLIVDVIEKFNIREKVFYVGTDNGSNVVKASAEWMPGFMDGFSPVTGDGMADGETFADEELVDPDELEFEASAQLANDVGKKTQSYCGLEDRGILLRCFTHTLQICLKTPVSNCLPLNHVIEKLSKALTSARKIPEVSELIEDEFGRPYLSRIPHRWNNNFKIAEVAKAFPWAASGQIFKEKHHLSTHDVAILEEFVGLTRHYETMSVKLQASSYPAVCNVIPAMYYIRTQLETYLSCPGVLERYAKELLSELNKRLGMVDKDHLYMSATFLNPDAKLDYFDVHKSAEVKEVVLRMMRALPIINDRVPRSSSGGSATVNPFSLLRKRKADGLEETEQPDHDLSVEAEIQLYLCDKAKPFEGGEWNPLFYWKQNGSRFKRLAPIARQVLCATATTATVDRVFSYAGFLLSDRRLRTGDMLFETRLFCKVNSELMENALKPLPR